MLLLGSSGMEDEENKKGRSCVVVWNGIYSTRSVLPLKQNHSCSPTMEPVFELLNVLHAYLKICVCICIHSSELPFPVGIEFG